MEHLYSKTSFCENGRGAKGEGGVLLVGRRKVRKVLVIPGANRLDSGKLVRGRIAPFRCMLKDCRPFDLRLTMELLSATRGRMNAEKRLVIEVVGLHPLWKRRSCL